MADPIGTRNPRTTDSVFMRTLGGGRTSDLGSTVGGTTSSSSDEDKSMIFETRKNGKRTPVVPKSYVGVCARGERIVCIWCVLGQRYVGWALCALRIARIVRVDA